MSQLNVNTIGARTGTTISIASGHTLDAIAMSLVTSGSVSAVTGLTLDNVFTSTFKNYLFQFNGEGITNNIEQCRLRFRAGGSTNSDSDHNYAGATTIKESGASSSQSYETDINASYIQLIGNWIDDEYFGCEISIKEPQVSGQVTSFNYNLTTLYNQGTHTVASNTGGGIKEDTGSFDGLYFYVDGSQTITGNYRLYGYK